MSVEMKLCYFMIYLIEALILLQYTSALFEAKYKKLIEVPFLLASYMVICAFSFIRNYFLNAATFFLANFIFIFFMYRISLLLALFHAVVLTAVMSASEMFVFNIISRYTTDFFADAGYLLNLVLLAAFSKLIYFLTLQLFSRFFCGDKEKLNSNNKSTLLLSFVPLVTLFVLLTFTSVSTRTPFFFSVEWMICISSFLMLGLNIFLFSFHQYIYRKNQKQNELELLLQSENASIEYYKMLLQQTENQKILVHDIKNHLQSIAILNENKDHGKIAAYIRRHTVDFMVSNDLTALFCNLLDNAVESSEKTPDSFIELTVSQKRNSPYTVITMTNTCRTDPFEKNTSRLPTKKGNRNRHGYGLKSIRRIVEKYRGDMKVYYENETTTFHTIITLKAG